MVLVYLIYALLNPEKF
ncbi:K(+)-transporting ATPase subunit F [Paenibacillus brasilensis]